MYPIPSLFVTAYVANPVTFRNSICSQSCHNLRHFAAQAVAGKSLGIHCLSKFELKAEEAEGTSADVAPVDEMHYGLKGRSYARMP